MRILLTGGSGFIGKNIIEQLTSRHEVIAPSHSALDLIVGEQVDQFFAENVFDVILHSAIKPGHRNAKDFSGLLDADLRMYFNLAKNAEKHKIKMFHFGSGCCYDMNFYRTKMAEDYMGTHIPTDPTGFAKYIASLHALKSGYVTDLRIFGIFGKYEDYSIRFISNAICKALHGLPVTLRQNRSFDYVYIDDFIRLLDLMMASDLKHHAYNITPTASASLYDLALIVKELSSNPVLPVEVALEGMGVPYSGDNTRLSEEFPDFAFTDIQESVRDLYNWYAQNKDHINRAVLLFDK